GVQGPRVPPRRDGRAPRAAPRVPSPGGRGHAAASGAGHRVLRWHPRRKRHDRRAAPSRGERVGRGPVRRARCRAGSERRRRGGLRGSTPDRLRHRAPCRARPFREYTAFSDGDRCARCGASSFAGGPFLRYHLVQGTRFDPWASVAVALRHLSTDELGDTSGLDWLRLELGADWYALSQIGFGPYAGLTLGTFTD